MKKPSVTQLLDLLAKPALIGWANKQGLQGIDIAESRKKALADGTSIHAQIENAAFDLEEDADRFAGFMAGKEIIGQEQRIETEWFIGRYDACLMVDGDEYIVDYKSGFRGRMYIENKLQLIAYTMARPAKMAIVSAPEFCLYPFFTKDRKPYEEMLIALSKVWHMKGEIESD